MALETLDQFGNSLMQQVRDDVIVMVDATLDGKMTGQSEDPVYQKVKGLSPDTMKALHDLMPLAVDLTLQFLLSYIEQAEELDLVMASAKGGQSLKRLSGGLSDELHGKDGWIARFSKQRNFEEDIFNGSQE